MFDLAVCGGSLSEGTQLCCPHGHHGARESPLAENPGPKSSCHLLPLNS